MVIFKQCPTCGSVNEKSDEWILLRWKPLIDSGDIPANIDLQLKVAKLLEKVAETLLVCNNCDKPIPPESRNR
jgi:translation initiation factor 2 beta subunit (eIF-2beta)/eIF-5